MKIERGVIIEEKRSTNEAFVKEVGGQRSNPVEERKASTRLQHEQRDCLLKEKTDNNSWPGDFASVPRSCPEAELKDQKSTDRHRAVIEAGILSNLK